MGAWLHRRLLAGWYSRHPIWILIPFSWVFAALAALRRAAYRMSVLKRTTLSVPVIVAGNITVGGTGKTPFIIWLAQALEARGHKPGIVTRGYGGNADRPLRVTADADPREVGDESVLLARRTGLPVAAGRDRVAAARLLVEQSPVDVILSDDGLQHHRLPRVLEIVLMDGERGLGNGWLLPAGPLREKSERLDDVALVVIKRAVGGVYSRPGAVHMDLSLDAIVSFKNRVRLPVSKFKGQKVHALAGIGHPQQFFAALASAGLEVDGRPLPDHAGVGPEDLRFDDDAPVFMTEKDAVKCRDMELPRHWYVEASARFSGPDGSRILELVQAALKR